MDSSSKASDSSFQSTSKMGVSSNDYDSDKDSNESEAHRLLPKDGHMEMGDEDEIHRFKPQRRTLWSRLKPSKLGRWLIVLFFTCLFLLLATNLWFYVTKAPPYGQSPPWYPTPLGGTAKEWAASYEKASVLVYDMTLVEKINVTTGVGWMMGLCVGNTGPVPRLGFPSLCLQDGPLGIRFADHITAWPAGITVAATWDRELMFKRGQAHGQEARLKQVNVLLGPAMGPIGRSPLGGRNWEGFGSDPVLQGIAAAETIKGIQSEGVIATAKHWVGNEQEHFRQAREWFTPNAISSNIDDRTLHEIYAWPFQDSVRAGVASVMCSYNQVNNSYACQNSKLMNGVLKDELGFQGFIQSDWLAQRSGVASALAGLDVSMPGDGLLWQDGNTLWGPHLTTAVLNGSVPITRLNDMVTRVVAAWYQLGQDDKNKWGDGPNFSSWTTDERGLIHAGSDDKTTAVVNKFVNTDPSGEHGKLARKIAADSIVLLKNSQNFLPLKRTGWPKNKSKQKSMKYQIGIFGSDAFPDPKGPNSCVDRACNSWTLGSGWGSGAVEFPYLTSPWEALENEFNTTEVQVNPFKSNHLSKSDMNAVKQQNLCLVFINSDAGEGYKAWDNIKGDRNDLYAQNGGEDLVKSVSDSCGNGNGDVVVIIHSVGPILVESFVDNPNVKAILFANLPGQESGNALKDVLFGDVNPSGHLPFTIGKSLKDYGPAAEIIRTVTPLHPVPQQNFSEGLLIDYRHFDHFDIVPRYEFGFGLSYTSFELSNVILHLEKPKEPLPAPRPNPEALPPSYNTEIPDPETALFPKSFRKLKKYIYPYITSTKGIHFHSPAFHNPSPISAAGGAQGGNPSLFDTIATVTATLKNTGSRAGSAVVQLYVSLPPGYVNPTTNEEIDFPVRVLRNFQKIHVQEVGGTVNVEMNITRRDLSYWSTAQQNWVLPSEGEIKLSLGFSSRDLPLSVKF
jgi:beta-glucosidase-like glycosyl hydrolase